MASLLDGRNTVPLTDGQIQSVASTLFGLDRDVPFIYREDGPTVFRVRVEDGHEIAEIAYGTVIYPGPGVANANSQLGMKGAVAHEICHFHRHRNLTELDDERLRHIDEAMTSLEAIGRFPRDLSDHDMRELVADALQRLRMFTQYFLETFPEP